ncbi:hypothetical protein EBZ39_06025 [bacterium]|nr:hypothetical protein [bacterium]
MAKNTANYISPVLKPRAVRDAFVGRNSTVGAPQIGFNVVGGGFGVTTKGVPTKHHGQDFVEYTNSNNNGTIELGYTATALNANTGQTDISLPNGVEGEEITIFMNSKAGTDFDILPTSANILGVTTKITLDAVGDSVTLRCLKVTSSTTKWVIVGGNGYTVS